MRLIGKIGVFCIFLLGVIVGIFLMLIRIFNFAEKNPERFRGVADMLASHLSDETEQRDIDY